MKSITVAAAIALAWAGALSAQTAVAQSAEKSRAHPKLSTTLLALQRAEAKRTTALSARAAARRTPYMLRTNGDSVEVSAFGADPAALRAELESKGMQNAKVHDYSVSGRVPISAITDMANTPGLQF